MPRMQPEAHDREVRTGAGGWTSAPPEGGELDHLAVTPRATPVPAFAGMTDESGMTDEFGLVQPEDGLGQSLPPSAFIGSGLPW